MRSKQEAAVARASAAQRDEARSRLSGLEVERQGYVARGDEDGAAAVDDEISKYKEILGDEDGDEPIDLAGLDPAEVFQMLGVPDEVVEAFAASVVAKAAGTENGPDDAGKDGEDQKPGDQAGSDTTAEPTTSGRRGRAKAAASGDTTPAGD